MLSAVCGGIRVASIYAPNGRVVDSPFYLGKLRWFERLTAWAAEATAAGADLVIGGDYNVAPTDDDVWSAPAAHGGTHVSEQERAGAGRLRDVGFNDAYREHESARGRFSWWDYRAGMFHKNQGMRIDLLYVTPGVADRGRLGGDRPRGSQGTAHPVGPCAGGHRPGRTREALRRRLGRPPCPASRRERNPHRGAERGWDAACKPAAVLLRAAADAGLHALFRDQRMVVDQIGGLGPVGALQRHTSLPDRVQLWGSRPVRGLGLAESPAHVLSSRKSVWFGSMTWPARARHGVPALPDGLSDRYHAAHANGIDARRYR